MSLLEVSGLKKVYKTRFGGNAVEALRNVNFSVNEGEYVAIMGESGSRQNDASEHSRRARQAHRRRRCCSTGGTLPRSARARPPRSAATISGFVFQEFNLLDTFTLEDNIYLPLVLAGKSYDEMRTRLIDHCAKRSASASF